jgi:hypothetical protein
MKRMQFLPLAAAAVLVLLLQGTAPARAELAVAAPAPVAKTLAAARSLPVDWDRVGSTA